MPFSGKEGINLVWESEGAWGVVVFDFSDLFVEEILLSLCVNAFLSVLWRRLVGHAGNTREGALSDTKSRVFATTDW